MTKLKDDDKQSVSFSRSGVKDSVTGSITYSDWDASKKTIPAYNAPEITGYTADQSSAPAVDVTPDSEDTTFTFTYTPVSGTTNQLTINIVDEDNSNAIVGTITKQGAYKTGVSINASTESAYTSVLSRGYVLSDNNKFPMSDYYYTFSESPYTLSIIVKHGTTTVTDSKTVSRTIYFQTN